MSSELEFEGKAVDNAVQKASEALNIPKEQLKYNVISYGSSGIFGLVGVKKAKIAVTVPKKSQENNYLASESSKEEIIDDSESISSLVKEAFNETEHTSVKKPFPQESILLGTEALQRIIDFITVDAKISVEEAHDRILFNIKGGNAGVLIGKRGQTLEAIQYLVEKIINKKSEERIRIQIDVEGYLENRRSNLESLAKRLAEKTKKTGKPSTLGQMNAHDRRIVHLSLKDDTRVRTQSVGDGFYRKLVIFPKRKNFRRKKHY